MIKPVDTNELERLLPQFTGGKCINYAEMNITDEQQEILSHFEIIGTVKSVDSCCMFNVVVDCPFNDHNGNNHRYIIVDNNKIVLKCHSDKCMNDYHILWKREIKCLFDNNSDNESDNESECDDSENEPDCSASDNSLNNKSDKSKNNDSPFAFLYKQIDEFQNSYFNDKKYKRLFYRDFTGNNNYHIIKKYVEQYYFKINNPPCYLDCNGNQISVNHILENISFREKDVKNNSINIKPFSRKWCRDIDIKYYDTFGLYLSYEL